MKRLLQRGSVAVVCMAAFGLSAAVGAADPQADSAPPLDRKVLDEHVYKTLRDVINHGSTLYNSGDRAACYRLFEGALMTIRPLLDHRPNLQKIVENALADADRNPMLDRRAFILRGALDQIRADLNPVRKPSEEEAPRPVANNLWNRLGGEAGVKRVVDDFVDLAANDQRVDFTRGNKLALDEAKVKALKKGLVDWTSQQAGGPLKYTGPSMKALHKGMGITDDQFNATLDDLGKALEANMVKPEDIVAVLKAADSTRKDIVEAKSPAAKEPPDLIPETKKPENPLDLKPQDK